MCPFTKQYLLRMHWVETHADLDNIPVQDRGILFVLVQDEVGESGSDKCGYIWNADVWERITYMNENELGDNAYIQACSNSIVEDK